MTTEINSREQETMIAYRRRFTFFDSRTASSRSRMPCARLDGERADLSEGSIALLLCCDFALRRIREDLKTGRAMVLMAAEESPADWRCLLRGSAVQLHAWKQE